MAYSSEASNIQSHAPHSVIHVGISLYNCALSIPEANSNSLIGANVYKSIGLHPAVATKVGTERKQITTTNALSVAQHPLRGRMLWRSGNKREAINMALTNHPSPLAEKGRKFRDQCRVSIGPQTVMGISDCNKSACTGQAKNGSPPPRKATITASPKRAAKYAGHKRVKRRTTSTRVFSKLKSIGPSAEHS
jgi:hypothetical protein